MSAPSPHYLLGHSEHERRRLALQAAVLNPGTEEFLVRAGVRPGMRLLDAGCGVGEVALIAARLVGPEGHVTAIDLDGAALEVSRARAADAGLRHVHFEQADLAEHRAKKPYDAVVGRHILIHTRDPLAVLRHVSGQVRPGGLVAFHEYDLPVIYTGTPAKPLFGRALGWIVDLFQRAAHPDLGGRLFALFQEAGLTEVRSRAEYLMDGGPDCPFYEWLAETVRSVLPKLEAAGIATAGEVGVETLGERLKREAVELGGCVACPVMVGACGRRA